MTSDGYITTDRILLNTENIAKTKVRHSKLCTLWLYKELSKLAMVKLSDVCYDAISDMGGENGTTVKSLTQKILLQNQLYYCLSDWLKYYVGQSHFPFGSHPIVLECFFHQL